MPFSTGRRPAGPWTVVFACVLVGAVLVGAVAVVGLRWVRTAITDQVETSQRLLADERADQLVAALDQMRDRVEAVAGQPLFAAMVLDDPARVDTFLRTVSNLPGIVGYTLRDEQGRLVKRIPEDVGGWDTGTGRQATPATDRRDAFVQYAATVVTPSGRTLVLEQLVSIRELLPNWVRRSPGAGARVTLVRADGVVLIDPGREPGRFVGAELQRAVAAPKASVVTYEASAGVEDRHQIAAVRPVGQAGLVVVASQPQADAFAAAQHLTAQLMLLLLACSSVLAALAVIVVRAVQRLRRRIDDERREAERLALTDPLTGLANRRGLDLAVRDACARGGDVAVAALDVDGLKQVNDELGHTAGDHALHQVAELLRALVRPEDVVARIGGDEFIILWSGASGDRVELLEARLREVVGAVPSLDTGVLGLSVGMAHGAPAEFDRLLREADERCYADKRERKAVRF